MKKNGTDPPMIKAYDWLIFVILYIYTFGKCVLQVMNALS